MNVAQAVKRAVIRGVAAAVLLGIAAVLALVLTGQALIALVLGAVALSWVAGFLAGRGTRRKSKDTGRTM